jgi:dUTP pyrophosphatase
MEHNVKILLCGGMTPKRQTDGAMGYDLYVPKDCLVPRGRSIVKLGIKMEMCGLAAQILPRSGYASKGVAGYPYSVWSVKETERDPERYDCDIEIGLIDEDYRGEVGVILNNHDKEFILPEGSRVAQMVFLPVLEVRLTETDSLSDTTRGEGGFNSTGL